MSNYIEIKNVRLLRQTEKAGLFEIDEAEVWIPWSQIENNDEDLKDGYYGRIYITEWIAEAKGLL